MDDIATDYTQQPLDQAVTTGQTPRMTALQNLARQLPVASSRIAAGQQAARDMQLQQAVGAAPQGAAATGTAQQLGAAQAQTAGQQAVQRAQTGVAELSQIGGAGLQEQARANQQQIAGMQEGLQQQQMNNVQRLAAVNEDAKKQLYDKQMQFQRDQNGMIQFNAIQMADFATTQAQNQQQYQNWAQQAYDMNQKDLQAVQTAYQKVTQDLDQKYKLAQQNADEATMAQIAQQKAAAEQAMKNKENAAKNNMEAWKTGGTIVGTVAGGIIGSIIPGAGTVAGAAGGAMIGGAIGGGLGEMAGSANS